MDSRAFKEGMALKESFKEGARRHNATHALRLAVERMRIPPVERLRWVLDLARRDLDLLQPGERAALGFDLRGLVVHSLGDVPGYFMKKQVMPDADLRRYQKTIAAGIAGLLSDPPRDWPMPEIEPKVVVTETDPSGRRRFAVHLGGKEPAAILGGVAGLLEEAGEHLRACPECTTPFVATALQARYCSPQCSQRARNKRRG